MREMAVLRGNSENAKVIFEGKVESQKLVTGSLGAPSNAMSMTVRGAHRIVTLMVSRAYRGHVEGSVAVLTGLGEGDCGFDFETGVAYLVYADAIQDGTLFTSICSGTDRISQAGVALRVLRGQKALADDLLAPESYYQKYIPRWTSQVCGKVTKPDGSPLARADVQMSQVRDEPFPPKMAADPDLSKGDGTFCVKEVFPGRYLLTAEDNDYDTHTRWMAYYPGVTKRSESPTIEVEAGVKLSGMQFSVQKQSLYTVRLRIETPDDSPIPSKWLGVAIESPDHDALSYQESHGVESDGTYRFGLIPPGRYIVSSYMTPDFNTGQLPPEAAKWQMAKKEVQINGDGDVVLKLGLVSNR